jgi:hypothetical protein
MYRFALYNHLGALPIVRNDWTINCSVLPIGTVLLTIELHMLFLNYLGLAQYGWQHCIKLI